MWLLLGIVISHREYINLYHIIMHRIDKPVLWIDSSWPFTCQFIIEGFWLTYSHVRTVIDISVDVGVYSISTRDSGIVSGDIALSSEGLCKLHYLPKNSGISAGELIVTSGIGGVFPKNLVVGTVRSIELDSNGLSLSAAIEPAADIAGVTDVLVIKSFDGQSGGVSAESGEAGKWLLFSAAES